MKYVFKVKYGFGKNEFVLVEDGPELERAIYARIEKLPTFIAGKMIDGARIMLIEPDVHSYTGWFRSYEPTTADDFTQIERDMPKEIGTVFQAYYQYIERLMRMDKTDYIGTGKMGTESLLATYRGDKVRELACGTSVKRPPLSLNSENDAESVSAKKDA